MPTAGYLLGLELLYLLASVGLTVWLARTLFANGAVFLTDVFPDRPELAEALNRLLVTGFFMANLGYAFLLLQGSPELGAVAAVEHLVRRLGVLLVSLAVLHALNLLVFHRLRVRAQTPAAAPTGWPPPAWAAPPAEQSWTPPVA